MPLQPIKSLTGHANFNCKLKFTYTCYWHICKLKTKACLCISYNKTDKDVILRKSHFWIVMGILLGLDQHSWFWPSTCLLLWAFKVAFSYKTMIQMMSFSMALATNEHATNNDVYCLTPRHSLVTWLTHRTIWYAYRKARLVTAATTMAMSHCCHFPTMHNWMEHWSVHQWLLPASHSPGCHTSGTNN